VLTRVMFCAVLSCCELRPATTHTPRVALACACGRVNTAAWRPVLQQHKPVVLTKQSVDGIQLQGGTILGTSRGGANIKCVALVRRCRVQQGGGCSVQHARLAAPLC
jgi:hypothetical protein